MLELNSTEVEPIYIMENQIEIWKDINRYEGLYQVSNLGKVKSLTRYVKGKHSLKIQRGGIMKIKDNGNGYKIVSLSNGIKPKKFYIHRLVADAFIYNSYNKKHVNHINGIKEDNRVGNLEWCTQSENNIHSYNAGLRKRGEDRIQSKLTDKQVMEIRENKDKLLHRELGNKYNVCQPLITEIINRKRWKHI